MRLTIGIIEAAFELLRVTKVIGSWKIPSADDVEFRITRSRDLGCHRCQNGHHIIELSETRIGTLSVLLETLAHEIAHLKDSEDGTSVNIEHGTNFRKLARQVCRELHFDEKAF